MFPLVDRLVENCLRLLTAVLHLLERFGSWGKGSYYGIQGGIRLLANDTVDSSKKYDFVIMFKVAPAMTIFYCKKNYYNKIFNAFNCQVICISVCTLLTHSFSRANTQIQDELNFANILPGCLQTVVLFWLRKYFC